MGQLPLLPAPPHTNDPAVLLRWIDTIDRHIAEHKELLSADRVPEMDWNTQQDLLVSLIKVERSVNSLRALLGP